MLKGISDEKEMAAERAKQPAADPIKKMEEEELEAENSGNKGKNSGWFDKILDKTKEWFQADIDADF